MFPEIIPIQKNDHPFVGRRQYEAERLVGPKTNGVMNAICLSLKEFQDWQRKKKKKNKTGPDTNGKQKKNSVSLDRPKPEHRSSRGARWYETEMEIKVDFPGKLVTGEQMVSHPSPRGVSS